MRLPFIQLSLLFLATVGLQGEPHLDLSRAFLLNADFTADVHNKATNGNDYAGNGGTFDEVAGWDLEKGGWGVAATYSYGHQNTLHGKVVPATDPEGNNEGAALGIVNAWGGFAKYSQSVTLPAGDYLIRFQAFNANSGEETINLSGFVTEEGSEIFSTLSSFPSQQWTEFAVPFTLTETTNGRIQLGLGSANSGSGDKAGLFFHQVELFTDNDDLATYQGLLSTLTNEARSLYDAGGFHLPAGADLAAAIAAAQDPATGQSLASILDAMANLNLAMDELPQAYPPYNRLAAYIGEFEVPIDTYGRTDLIPYRDQLQTAYDNQSWDEARIDAEIARRDDLFYSVALETVSEKKYRVARRIPVDLVESSFPVGYSQAIAGDQHVLVYYDDNKNMTVAYRTLGENSFSTVTLNSRIGWDSHNYVTLIVDNEGYIHISGNMHNVPLVYFRSTRPYDASEFLELNTMVGSLEDNVTYPNFLMTNSGELLFHYRYGWSGNGYEVYNIWNPTTQTWSRFLDEALIDGQGQRNAYMKGPYYEADGYYHLYWVWRGTPDAATNHDFSYARSRDLINWETASGTPVARPMVFGENGLKVDDSATTSGTGILNGVQAHVLDSQNRIVLANMKYDDLGNSQFYLYRLRENGTWEEKRVSNWLYRYNFGGGGSLLFEITMRGLRKLGNGELGLSYSHSQYGDGEFIIDEETLEPIATRAFQFSYPEELNEVTLAGSYARPISANIDQLGPYLMHWETMGANNDRQPPGPLPPANMLEVIELEPFITNAGFENPEIAGSLPTPDEAGWTFAGPSGLAANDSALTSGNEAAPEGSQVAYLEGTASLSQTFADLIPGTTYHVDFAAAQRQSPSQAGETFDLIVDGVVVGNFAPNQGETAYQRFAAGFIAAETSHTVTFAGTNLAGGDNMVFIDDVRLFIANSPAQFSADLLTTTAAHEGEPYQAFLSSLASDPDGDALSFSKLSGPAWLQLTANGVLSGTPSARDAGSNTFTVAVSDGNGGSHQARLEILVYSALQQELANFHFETPATDNFLASPSNAGWTFAGAGVATNGSAFTAGNSEAPEGTQVAYIQGTTSLSQVLSGLTPGTSYQLLFAASQRQNKAGGQPGQTFEVTIGGAVAGSFEPPQALGSYTDYAVTFQAEQTQTTLAFVGTNLNGGDNTIFLDHVRVREIFAPLLPVVDSLSLGANGLVSLSWDSEAGRTYTILYKSDLRDGDWISLKTGIAGSGTLVTEAVSIDPALGKGFFKIRVE
ncbi:BNR-4 repeat-containing protein [Roseibacillus ishigakijimensis]|uniref:BNR-4 repeat-containing protein n=1 Tax=Roseibacillus ishigakijimensis TaxID=454146 RepID=A0A934VL51_9BACT|nr:BNR-4 repeat-containing protein [Roseibacillus ishigakijimensis]MBK1832862.1 BNR-4 repeat-containing protein [Roseibacillus ishigakijimensis]